MKNLSKKLLGPVQVTILSLAIAAAGSLAYAGSYQEPNCSPPSSSCNADAPVNVSGASQIKLGALTVASGSGIGTGLRVVNGDFSLDKGNAAFGASGGVGGTLTANKYLYRSDRSLKTNISPLSNSLSKILSLQGVSFNWKSTGKAGIGLIAQDVEKVYPELVSTDAKTGLKSVEYGNLTASLIEAVKSQQKEIDQLKARIQALESRK